MNEPPPSTGNPRSDLSQALRQAVEFHQRGDLRRAELLYREVLRAQPNQFEANHLLGALLLQQRRPAEALDILGAALTVNPDSVPTLSNFGLALQKAHRPEAALAAYDRALAIEPDYVDALYNRANALKDLNRFEETLASLDKALAIRPEFPQALSDRGNALRKLSRFDEALASYDKALAIRPDYADASFNRGNTLSELRRFEEALASYDKALAIKPDYAEALYHRGNALQNLRRLDEAVASYGKAVAIKPDYARAFHACGHALREARRLDEAIASYEMAVALDPELEFALGDLFHFRMWACDWRRYDADLARLAERVASKARVVSPFVAMASFDSSEIQFDATRIWVETKHAQAAAPPTVRGDRQGKKIRIGYYSSDFRTHAMSHLMIDVFRAHDKALFETYAFSFFNPGGDPLNAQLRSSFDHFVDASKMSDGAIASLSREHAIDIAVDLAGFTRGQRAGVVARRAAPIQVNFLGFPCTMAAPFIDYVIADATVVKADARRFFAEKIVSLPHTYYPTSYDNDLFRTERTFSRAELGLPEDAFVFCCFNKNYKITPDVFDVWMRILRRVEPSVLWLFEGNPAATANLRREASARGVDDRRLIFAPRAPAAEHLARQKLADLFLDTLPYNAHTTATDALWAGLPIVTKPGEAFAARVAASVLEAIGMPELVVDTFESYEALAIELATDRDRLAALKQKLARNRATFPLFDTAGYTRALERAYAAMHARWRAGLPPDDIVVAP